MRMNSLIDFELKTEITFNLTELNLDFNRLKKIPSIIWSLPNLTKLSLIKNRIYCLDSIEENESIKELYLSCNKIQTLIDTQVIYIIYKSLKVYIISPLI